MLESGDEIIVPANTYIASILAITQNELVPYFVEPDEDINISAKNILNSISAKTKAILIHLYGRLAPMDKIMEIARQHKLLVLRMLQLPSFIEWEKSGSWAASHLVLSREEFGALGDAGALVSNDQAVVENVRKLGNYGSSKISIQLRVLIAA